MCNDACIAFVRRVIGPDDVRGKRVLEVGSFDTTGSVRPHIEGLRPAEYLGVDIVPGPSVDELCDVLELESRYGPARFDVVITTEMLEHVRDWRRAWQNLKAVLAPDGLLVATTRSRGFRYHFGPDDWWRYELDDLRRIVSDMELIAIERDPLAPGAFVAARKTMRPKADLNRIDLYSMIVGGRVHDVRDRDVRLFEWTSWPRWRRRLGNAKRRLGIDR